MKILSQNAEIMLRIFLNKYEDTNNYMINGDTDEFPNYFNIIRVMQELDLYGLISMFTVHIDGSWNVVITPEALEYFKKKGCRVELFEELVENEKKLLMELLRIEKEDGSLTNYLQDKLQDDSRDIFRGIIGTLYSNGLISLFWADDTVYDVSLTQAGRSYFEREKKYNEKSAKSISNTYNFGDIHASNSNLVLGEVKNSILNIDNSISMIEQKIDVKCENDEERQELKALLEETKEIVENIKESRHIDKRKSFFQKLSTHLEKHSWFYAEIVGLLGQTALILLGGQ